MRWRTIAIAAAVVMLSVAASFAQGRGAGGGRGERPQGGAGGAGGAGGGRAGGAQGFAGAEEAAIREILGQLNLTDEQMQKLDEIKADFEKKGAEVRDKLRAQMEEMRKAREGNDQKAMRKAREEMAQGLAPMRDLMQNYVNDVKGVLNDDQKKKFDEQIAARGGLQALAGNGRLGQMMLGAGQPLIPGTDPRSAQEVGLTEDQKTKVVDLNKQFADEMKKLQEKYVGLVKEVLTDEQKPKYEKAAEDAKNRPMMGGPGMQGGRMGGGRRGQGGAGDQRGNGGNENQPPPPPPPGDGPAN